MLDRWENVVMLLKNPFEAHNLSTLSMYLSMYVCGYVCMYLSIYPSSTFQPKTKYEGERKLQTWFTPFGLFTAAGHATRARQCKFAGTSDFCRNPASFMYLEWQKSFLSDIGNIPLQKPSLDLMATLIKIHIQTAPYQHFNF